MSEVWEYDNRLIEDTMREISNFDKPSVFNVCLQKKDYSSSFIAYATLRADGRSFSVEHGSALIALQELQKVLASLYCPTCHQLKSKEAQDE